MAKINCHACGKAVEAEAIDAKPGPGHWTAEQLSDAADTGAQFDRLECADCYGPNYCALGGES